MSQLILVGADPEIFVTKDNIFTSAHGLIRGDKKNPQKVRNGAVQVDGMALEFNIDPASSEEQFVLHISDVLEQMGQMVPGYKMVVAPVADFTPEHMAEQPPEALELGCEPDYNAWESAMNPRPDGNRAMRTAAGHVHIGWTSNQDPSNPHHVDLAYQSVKQMDFFLGLPSLMYDAAVRRREMYGKAGACRVKSYGVEYRTLSNAWLKSPKLMAWVFRATKAGMLALMDGRALVDEYGDIQNIINTSDVKAAEAIINAAGIEVPYA